MGTKLKSTVAVSILGLSLLSSGCAHKVVDEEVAIDTVEAEMMLKQYVVAVTNRDVQALRSLAFYPHFGTGESIEGEILPLACFETEIDTLLGLGVHSESAIDIVDLARNDVEVEGAQDSVSYSILVAQIELGDGDSVGRGVIPLPGGVRVQLEPSVACDNVLASASP